MALKLKHLLGAVVDLGLKGRLSSPSINSMFVAATTVKRTEYAITFPFKRVWAKKIRFYLEDDIIVRVIAGDKYSNRPLTGYPWDIHNEIPTLSIFKENAFLDRKLRVEIKNVPTEIFFALGIKPTKGWNDWKWWGKVTVGTPKNFKFSLVKDDKLLNLIYSLLCDQCPEEVIMDYIIDHPPEKLKNVFQ